MKDREIRKRRIEDAAEALGNSLRNGGAQKPAYAMIAATAEGLMGA